MEQQGRTRQRQNRGDSVPPGNRLPPPPPRSGVKPRVPICKMPQAAITKGGSKPSKVTLKRWETVHDAPSWLDYVQRTNTQSMPELPSSGSDLQELPQINAAIAGLTRNPHVDKMKENPLNRYHWFSEGREHPVVRREAHGKDVSESEPRAGQLIADRELTSRYQWFSEKVLDRSIYYQPGPKEGLVAGRRAPMDGVQLIIDQP
mmetsp:Transcript_57039/g.105448  ORF Transcript_57039/g.105448 Transcript_57039/m.105448 type:complete len:204 (+) Transcript_57039:69-680(+)